MMPEFAQLREIVNQDVKGHSSKREREWLRSAPIALLWYIELRSLIKSLNDQIATRRRKLSPLKPPSGQNASEEYLKAKFEFDEWHGRTLHVLSSAKTRLEEARFRIRILGLDLPERLALDTLRDILEITEADSDDAEELLIRIQNLIDRVLGDHTNKSRVNAAS